METWKGQALKGGTRAFAASVAVSSAFLAGIAASNGASPTSVVVAVLGITAAAPLTVRRRSRPAPLEAIRKTVNRPD
jgi:hypothetical protein